MKRIAAYYESGLGRHDGMPLYLYKVFTRDFKDKYEFVHLAPNGDWEEWGRFDFNIWPDWGEDALKDTVPYTVQECPRPNAYWTSDTHLGYDYRLEKAKDYDFVFCTQKGAIEKFKKDGIKNPIWLPHAVEPLAYPNQPAAIKKYDVGFVGHVNNEKRASMLDVMFREFPEFYFGQRLFEDAAEIYRKSKIVFNTAAVDDINMRIFEVLATGSFLLTEKVPYLEELFKDGVHLVTYKNMDEAVDKAKFYLENEAKREKIAKAGMEEVLAKHTYKHRVNKMLKEVKLWD